MKINFVGIDVSARKLDVAVSDEKQKSINFVVENNEAGFQQLIRKITKGGDQTRVVMEATGIYSLPLAVALHDTERCQVMVANPRQTSNFAKVRMARNKNDSCDARVLLAYAQTMPFLPWQRPDDTVLELQNITRRIFHMKEEIGCEKQRLGGMKFRRQTKCVVNDIEVNIRHLERRVGHLLNSALAIIKSNKVLHELFLLLISVVGIAEQSGACLLAELMTLPKGLSAPQWVAHAGLDPREYSSGSSVHRPTRISKAGNRYLRAALFMPAFTARQFCPSVKTYTEKLKGRGKKPLQAIIAVMRKLLHCIWGMFKHQQPFDGDKFYRIRTAS